MSAQESPVARMRPMTGSARLRARCRGHLRLGRKEDVDGRVKPGHDEGGKLRQRRLQGWAEHANGAGRAWLLCICMPNIAPCGLTFGHQPTNLRPCTLPTENPLPSHPTPAKPGFNSALRW